MKDEINCIEEKFIKTRLETKTRQRFSDCRILWTIKFFCLGVLNCDHENC